MQLGPTIAASCKAANGVVYAPPLTLPALKLSASTFAPLLSSEPIPDLYGLSDGKAIGTFIEQKFRRYLTDLFAFTPGNSASGVDLPDLDVDLKATSITQPQSSSPFRNAQQKVYGLGYHLLVFVYRKTDDVTLQAARLAVMRCVFVEREHTGDWQTTTGVRAILDRQGNVDDVVAFLEDRNLPLDEIGREQLAERIIRERPAIGYLTISNALQWRLQYRRAIDVAGAVEGVEQLYG